MRKILAFTALALLVVSAAAFGQAQRGSIAVTVTDSDGQGLPGASITAVSDQTLTRRTVFTDAAGEATIVALDPATNYVVTVSLDGFATQTVTDLVVRAGQTQALAVQLGLAEIAEELIVTSESPLVDVTKTQAGQQITLQLTESLPTTRGYQGYLQLVPGVQDAWGFEENPASRSGLNYRDRDSNRPGTDTGDAGLSLDNLYYFDGIDVTNRTLGRNGADINTEIIQEQSVITGAIPAEFVGVPGLVSNVITKSGGNRFSGSVNYYFQDDSLVESNDHFADETFSTYDAAFTLGGPIVRDRAWFFASLRLLERELDVIDEQDQYLRTVTREQDQGFGKLTWSITDSDLLTGIFLNDPTDDDGSFRRNVPNAANSIFERGGERYSVSYNRVWGSAALELGYTDHEEDLFQLPTNADPLNEVSFAPGVDFTSAEASVGGAGTNAFDTNTTESARIALEYLFDTGSGDHALKLGYTAAEADLQERRLTNGEPPATYFSISPRGNDGSVLACEVTGGCAGAQYSIADFGLSTDETQGFRENLTATQMSTLLGLWDDNGNGFLDDSEILTNMVFSSTAGNPHGLINYTRDLQVAAGLSAKSSESDQYFIQDSWQYKKWSVNAGLRAEDTTFITDTGEDVGTWDTEVAPRVSIAYDPKGDGRSSIGFFWGEYYDAYRNNAIDFAGSLQGNEFEEQVWVEELGEWVNFRFRGGTTVQDAFFAPRIETPVTEELQLQYKRDLGRNMMFEVNWIDRETDNIGEDYGSIYYLEDQYATLGDPNAPDTLFLGPQFFGFGSVSDIPTNLNFLIGTLPPGNFRDWQGLELIFRKRYSNNWQLLASYNWADADGNSNSDANFDGAGDVFPLDPRAPNRTGTQPGLVEQLFKVHGSYTWDNGVQVGGSYRWNSGIRLNRNSGQAFQRSLPALTDTEFPSNGLPGTGGLFGSTWIADDALGYFDGNSYGVLDARVSYVWSIGERTEADFFLDIFNVLDDQSVIQIQDLESGGEGFAFMEGKIFVQPRRYFLGARLRF
jgi:hypothetical protein